jgi:alpha-galactosidase
MTEVANRTIDVRGISIGNFRPLVDGAVPLHASPTVEGDRISWPLEFGRLTLEIHRGPVTQLAVRLENVQPGQAVDSLGLRVDVAGARRYLRNGYQSWDGSYFVAPGTPAGDGPPGKAPTLGFAMTAFLPGAANGAVVLGYDRHDRFQTRFRFGGASPMTVDAETLIDRVPHDGAIVAETLLLSDDDDVEEALRAWSRRVAEASPLPPRVPDKRLTGWCSWYNLYAAIDDGSIREHLDAAVRFREQHGVAPRIFQIDDGFTPEMGDWLETKPQFPRGMAPLVRDISDAGFTPGLWIAPFMVGNRSRLYREHPDWVVRDRLAGGPLAQMTFYGEFRWHKRSEEYYILDITHPDAEAYIRTVFRTWARDWGAGYFKTDFMLFGAEHGPDRAVWHRPGLSRIAIWRKMAALIREEIGEALWLGCGCPLWASVGYVDAVRIGRDIGVSWRGEYSAESLLRDQLTRNHSAGILWQADPDCILLRDRFHELDDAQVRSLALFSGLSGGVLMTSDKLDELSPERSRLFADLLTAGIIGCDFPDLGSETPVVRQVARRADGSRIASRFNLAPTEVDGLPPFTTEIDTPL